LNVSIEDFCSLMRYLFELAWLVCMSSMDCSSYGSFDIKVTSSATVYVPEIETGRHVKNNACTVEIKIKWMIRKYMTYENTYRDDMWFILLSIKDVQSCA
jgi:hypothetical protein